MSLKNFQTLRTDFLLIGLTGRSGGGCNDVCEFLTKVNNPFEGVEIPSYLHVNEIQKFTICKNLLTDKAQKWESFTVIRYRDILLLFFLEVICSKVDNKIGELTVEILQEVFNSLYDPRKAITRRIGQASDEDDLLGSIYNFIVKNEERVNRFSPLFASLRGKLMRPSFSPNEIEENVSYLNGLYFNDFSEFSNDFFKEVDGIDPIARQLFLQDVACNLRSFGCVEHRKQENSRDADHIFTVTIAIRNFIKINRQVKKPTRVVIDSLKNSLEINFFKERYSGFYLIAARRDEESTDEYLRAKISRMGFEGARAESILENIRLIDNAHYQVKDFKDGEFTTPDVENCIQKADYYIYVEKAPQTSVGVYSPETFIYLDLTMQLLKFLALVQKPGLVTPSAIERSMQLAFSSKYNSGCISRQVGAVITDAHYAVKSVGWNEVPQGQTPCALRSLKELANRERENVYSAYERIGGNYGGLSFRDKVNETLLETYGNENEFFNNLDGHNCAYCFKDFHNAYEGKENQVHTRSLHAEENAMLQISKFGGQGLHGGVLFTTASPCELCSKKAFQLGVKKIFYIDPYPGIAKQQVLTAGNKETDNPQLFMFQGAVGRGYFKLYEPYMSIKDETYLRTGIKPKGSERQIFNDIKRLLSERLPDNAVIKRMKGFDELLGMFENEDGKSK